MVERPKRLARLRLPRRSATRGDRPDHVDPLADQFLSGVAYASRRRAKDVDMTPLDRAAGVPRDEPAAVAVVAIGGNVDPAPERDHRGIDGDRLVVAQREPGPRG